MLTAEWAISCGISPELGAPAIEDALDPPAMSAAKIASRSIILHGVAAVGAGVDGQRVATWFKDQGLWSLVTPNEKACLTSTDADSKEAMPLLWRKEAEWTLLWVIGKVEALGLPVSECNTTQLVDTIMPGLGDETEPFIKNASLRPSGEIFAEDERTYDIWCRAHQIKSPQSLPADLNMRVLYERRYAFEWLDGLQAWDEVNCDT